MTDLVDLTIAGACAALRRAEVSSLDLVDATLQRIDQTEPTIHAYVHVYRDQARASARRRDNELRHGGWRGALHGIPIAIKDLLYTADAPTEAGSDALRGFSPDFDAAVVERLCRAGAVIIGKTVTHELAYGVNVPPTRSPWAPDHYPGGSSAGSGAAVAARSAFGAIGTDTGGSIREPAALNGLVGLKPTYGLVSRYGIFPLSYSLDHAGPITRTVTDNALLLDAIAGYDPRDPGSAHEPVPDYPRGMSAGVKGMRLGVERRYFFGRMVWPEVLRQVDAAIGELREMGAEIVEVCMPELDAMGAVGLTILLGDASAEYRALLRERGHRLDPATRVMLELGELVPASHYVQALRGRALLQRLMRRLFETNGLDALVGPTLPTTTVHIDVMSLSDQGGDAAMTQAIDATWPANITGLPALTLPCGFSEQGLPVGLQLMGRPFGEAALYRLARAYEHNHDWHTRRPPSREADLAAGAAEGSNAS